MRRRGIGYLGLSLLASVLLALGFWPSVEVPEFTRVRDSNASSYAVMLDRQGRPLVRRRVDFDTNRLDWLPLQNMSPALLEAVQFAEDRDFQQHAGIDWAATAQAAWQLLQGDRSRGASTLSMQLAGLLEPDLGWRTGGRSLLGKWRQMRYAKGLEARWSKAQILEAYLNLVPFRGDLTGAEAASAALYGKPALTLDNDEALLLAALLAAPAASVERVARRACVLAAHGFANASCEHLEYLAATRLQRRRIPLDETPELAGLAHRHLSSAQRRVATTLDADVQAHTLARVRAQLAALQGREVNAAAALVLDNASGDVLAYVANVSNQDDGRLVDAITALRQAGSTLKPFLYQLAFEKRLLTAASLLDDSAIRLPTPQGLYIPQNYEKDFKGLVTARTALASSLNVPAVRVQLLVGVEDFWARLRALGFDSLTEEPGFYGHALALGDGDVSLWMLANAYRSLAQGGVWSPAHLLPSVPPGVAIGVMDPGASFIVADILQDRRARALTFDFENALATPFWSAVKTGTSKDMRDNWCIGFSARYTVAVWVGNLDGAPMRDVSGISGAAPIWADIMDYLEGNRWQVQTPTPPAGLVTQQVHFSGLDEPDRREWFLPGTSMSEVRYALADGLRIAYPANETLFAIDPDIPADRQSIHFTSNVPNLGTSWKLNGQWLANGHSVQWSPAPGRFRLSLHDDQGEEQDAVVFTVRGHAREHLRVPAGD
ncbi:MAG: penicillin-binding protein 1C [Pseudomonas sp.]|uniref:penicillin-binding protein 1C n=1 Tax=Pseudomonas sp. TaxID=306 RepID=UPI00339229FA